MRADARGTAELTRQVLTSLDGVADPRLRHLLVDLVRHLHTYCTDNQVTNAEWALAVDFLTSVGQACTAVRQETVLLSDVLGVSMLVELLGEERADTRATAPTVLGPFHMTSSPPRPLGASTDQVGVAAPLVVHGTVTSTDGQALGGATLDVWQSDGDGFYDVQVPDRQPAGNGRGLFTAADDGSFWFRTVAPAPYPIPTDGPVGALLRFAGRHPYRPAHLHFIVRAQAHRALTTHVFMAGSPFLDSDAVFAVRSSLVVRADSSGDRALAERCGVATPFASCRVDLVLAPEPGGARDT